MSRIANSSSPWIVVGGFFLLTYLLSWLKYFYAFENLFFEILNVAGPTFAAIIMVVVVEGRKGLDRLFAPLFQGQASPVWYAAALLIHPIIAIIAILGLVASGSVTPQTATGIPWALLPAMFGGRLLINVWEEVGWRGYALPRLQHPYNALTASLIIGLFWGLWHLPDYLAGTGVLADIPPLLFFGEFVIVSIIYTWLYNSTGGSLLFVTLFHVMGNVSALIILEAGFSITPFLLIRVLLIALVAATIIVRYGPQQLSV